MTEPNDEPDVSPDGDVSPTGGVSADAAILAREYEAVGPVQIGIASSRVIAVSFPATVPDDAVTEHPLLDRLGEYFDGVETTFSDEPVAFTVPTDQRTVLESTREIPYGKTVDVETLARTAAGVDADDTDTVRAALRANPAPILVPDHRVRGVDGATPPRVASVCRSIEDAAGD